MQNAIFELLKTDKYDYKKVFIEKDRVDIKAITRNGIWHYFELKTDNPKLSIRKAIGQIMEYAYYPDKEKADKLIIISDNKPNEKTIDYLNHIRTKFDLPVTYRSFNLETNELSDDY
jgi:indole-3-glycerol phosphate synthase